MRARLGAWSLAAGFGFLVLAWSVSDPIGAGPDEMAHYIKALGVGSGQWTGSPVTKAQLREVSGPWIDQTLSVEPLVLSLTKQVQIPPRLQPGVAGCTRFDSLHPATCLERPGYTWGKGNVAYTYLGTYQPFVYLPAGLVMDATRNPTQAFIAGRLVFGGLSLLLVCAGLWLLFRLGRGGPLLVGVLLAMTPMVVFTFASVGASAIEIGAGVAVLCAVLHLAYAGDRPRWAWTVLGIAGATLALSRTLGPLWLVLALLLIPVVRPPREMQRLASAHRAWTIGALVMLALGAAASLAWQIAVQPSLHSSLSSIADGIFHGVESIAPALQSAIGIFGWLDTFQSSLVYLLWGAMLVGLVVLAWLAATSRERRLLLATIGVTLIVIPVLYGVIAKPAGGAVQGRWILPFAVAVPLVCGVILSRAPSSHARRWVIGTAALVAVIQFLAIYQNARRYAVGANGRFLFLSSSQWAPPKGWVLWLSVALLGCAALVAASVLLTSRERPAAATYSASPDPASAQVVEKSETAAITAS